MALIFFAYGLAVYSLGAALFLQARSPLRILPARSLWLLSMFGFVHGTAEWVKGALWMASNGIAVPGAELLKQADPLFTGLSFFPLMGFGVETLCAAGVWPCRVRYGVIGLLGAWVFLAGAGLGGAVPLSAVESVSRAAVGFPGSLAAAFALYKTGRRYGDKPGTRLGSFLTLSSAIFLLYAFLAGLPAASLNVAVIVLRAACIVAAAILLSEAFVVETGVMHAHLEAMRRQFVSMVAHDLGTFITTIDLSAQLLEGVLRGSPALAGESHHVRRIRRVVAAADRLIGDFFDAAVIEAHGVELRKRRVDLKRVLGAVALHMRDLHGRHPIRLSLPPGEAFVEADRDRVEQVLINLLSNAVKYSSVGTEIVVSLEGRPGELVVSVSNEGPGISEEDQKSLFQLYRRAPGAERRAAGTGLGLYIVKQLVEQHGGRVWVESKPSGPTVFRFTLPAPGPAS